MLNKTLHVCHSLDPGGITTFVTSLVNLNVQSKNHHDILVWKKSADLDHVRDISQNSDKKQHFKQIISDYSKVFVHSLKPFMLQSLYEYKHSVYLFQHGMTYGSGFKKIYKQFFYFFAINVLGFKVICSSETAKDKLTCKVPVLKKQQIIIIPFGIYLNHTEETTPSTSTLNIGFAGRLVPQKRVNCIIDALNGLEQPINFYIAGEGHLKNDLIKDAEHFNNSEINIHFLGNLTDMDTFYSKLDVLILPSYNESYGLVVIEALSYNIPVIVFDDSGACTNFIDNDYNGYIVSDVEGLRIKLQKLTSVELRQQLKNQIKQSDLSKYDISITKQKLDSL